jgi:hypothetical protein
MLSGDLHLSSQHYHQHSWKLVYRILRQYIFILELQQMSFSMLISISLILTLF